MKKFLVAIVLSCLLLPGLILAQGVTSAALTGTVLDSDGKPLPGATVKAVHTPSGTPFETTTRLDGRFDILGARVGGPYTVTATMPGFTAQSQTDIILKLSESRSLKFTLAQEKLNVDVSVTAPNPVISQSRTGAEQNISTTVIETMPSIGRSFDDFARISPQIDPRGSGAVSAAGRSNKYNSIQIDGAVNNDLFGLSSSGTPGLSAPISLDAVQEFEIVLAPYDVRYGGFTGAGLNAITRSGTNRFSGSAYYFGRNENYVGKGPDNTKYGTFSEKQYGLRLGGPIIKDKLFFFLSAEMGRRNVPTTYVIDDSGTSNDFGGANITVADAQRFVDILKSKYGYDPGGFGAGYRKVNNDNDKLFFRLDYNINSKNRLTLRHNYINGLQVFNPSKASSSVFPFGDDYYTSRSKTNSTVLQLHSTLSRDLFNELIVNYTTIRDAREIGSDLFPQVNVLVNGGYRLTAGSEQYSGANALNQNILEITDNLTWSLGNHMLTIGTHNEFFKFSNLYIRNLYGYWEFSSLNNFENGIASRYYHDFYTANPSEQWAAGFSVAQLGGYVGDKWSIRPNLALTLGVRLDVPIINSTPAANPLVNTVFGIRTDQAATGNLMFSPRLGFNWDMFNDKSTQVRGGVGIFSGRTPYVWISNQFANTGMEFTRLDIKNPAFAFVADPLNQPAAGVGTTSEIDLIDKDFKYPQVMRANLAVDHELPFGIIGTLEFVYSRNLSEILYQNLNLRATGETGMGGRTMYKRDVSTSFTDVIYLTNSTQGYQYNVSLQLQKNFSDKSWLSAYYTYGQAKDVNSGTSSQAASNFVYNPIRYNVNQPELTWSNYDVRHRFGAAFSWQIKLFAKAPTSLSMFYGARSGRPYSTTYNYFDANGDGATGNDLVYVPASLSEVIFTNSSGVALADQEGNWATFDAFIKGDPGLNDYRGKIVPRNSSREPWLHSLDARLSQDLPIPALKDNQLQLTVDIINLINLIDRNKGLYYYVSSQNDIPWTSYGIDAATGKMKIGWTNRTSRYALSQLGSRWQVQLGIRYKFN
ncbi:MAG: carboxypeptidase regulatory-like domain-containing protein [Candidatus Aminicenantes bacterium]|nr:carboxypeptidase regulatory-like domain-containing protein [Candidatus Aminicenantes bacterium]